MQRTNSLRDKQLRRRRHKDILEPSSLTEKTVIRQKTVPKSVPIARLPSGCASLLCCVLLPLLFSYLARVYSKRRLPQDRHKSGSKLLSFNKENAIRHVRTIARKPRFVCTAALEESLQYIQHELEKLQVSAQGKGLELDVHLFRSKADSFSTSVGNVNLINSYNNMSSVVARIRPINLKYQSEEKSLLINAHVDSAIGAPGANDDAAAVGIMMEIIRCISEHSSDDASLRRPIIFLFNGGEEVVLPAAHSFITQHPWAPSIAAHINMESIGSGDSFHLFRLGPGSPWLANAFARSVSVPSGAVIGTDVFNSKLIPAETDFRIFDEVGGIPGFDLALLDNGYIYHTAYDSVEQIDEVGICHGGDTVLELLMELAGPADAIGRNIDSGKERPCVKWYDSLRRLSLKLGLGRNESNQGVTFFDILHVKTIVYEEGVAVLINMTVVIMSAILWIVKLSYMGRRSARGILRMFFVAVASITGAIASATFTSLIYSEILGSKLRWYGNWRTALLIYAPPTAFGIVTAMLLTLPRKLSAHRFDEMLFVISTMYGLVSVIFTRYGIMSSYIPTGLLLVASICAAQGPRIHTIIRHGQLMAAHALLGANVVVSSLSTILPLLGRIKSSVVPHDTIAALMISLLFLTDGALSSLPMLCYYCHHLRRLRAAIFMFSIAVAVGLLSVVPRMQGSSSKFTYNADAPKRLSAIHFFSPQQDPPSVLWLGSQDAVPMARKRILSDLNVARHTDDSTSIPTWGSMRSTALETFRPFEVFFQEAVAVPVDSSPNLPLPSAYVVHEDETSAGWNITVHAEALESHLLTVRLQTGSKSNVKQWSINSEMPDAESGAWIKHTGTTDFQFWLLLRKTSTPQRPNVTLALSSGRLGFSRSPGVLRRLKFEDWETPAVAVCTGVEVVL